MLGHRSGPDHFVRRLYNADPSSVQHYHLVIDPTVLSTDGVVEVLTTAAELLRPPDLTAMPTQRESWHGDDYQARFDRLAASGVDVHGEAELIVSFAPASVLDAGRGLGRVAVELGRRGIDVVGADVDASMLATARHLPGLSWRQRPRRSGSGRTFDVVVMAGNVPLFTPAGTRPGLVSGVARHVAPGGVLVAGFSRARLRYRRLRRRLHGGRSRARLALVDVGPGAVDAGDDAAVSVHRYAT